MLSIDSLLGIIATEAVGGGIPDHHFDEFRNKDYVPKKPEPPKVQELPFQPIKYTLELIKRPDGSLYWIE